MMGFGQYMPPRVRWKSWRELPTERTLVKVWSVLALKRERYGDGDKSEEDGCSECDGFVSHFRFFLAVSQTR